MAIDRTIWALRDADEARRGGQDFKRGRTRFRPLALGLIGLAMGACSCEPDEGGAAPSEQPDDGLDINLGSDLPGDSVPSTFTKAEIGGWKLGSDIDSDTNILTPQGGMGGASDSDDCGSQLTGIVRDFKDRHPDFERDSYAAMTGLVEKDLGEDEKPVYSASGATKTTTGPDEFAQWYRDVPDVNQSFFLTLHLVRRDGGVFTFESDKFFPLDDAGFGNQGRDHNFHFTFELHTEFLYSGGETFRFSGDDDVWVFINGQLAVDLGGVHAPQEMEIALDEAADQLGISPGQIYPFDMFHAERHTSQSNFRIDTTMEFTNCGVLVR